MRVVLVAAILASTSPISADAATVRAVRTIHSEDFTRLIVECSDRSEVHVSRLEGPAPRFAVDFLGASLPPEGVAPLSFEGGPAKTARVVRTESGVRLLIEARADASASTFPLLDPFRLVIDVGVPVKEETRRAAATPAHLPPQLHAGAKPPPEIRSETKKLKLVIDPGHGGHDPGARGIDDIEEKDVVLDVALRLADKARASGAFEVQMTRDSDVFVPLEERTARANAFAADLFVSIHANAAPSPELNGLETYYLNNTNDHATIRLARMENGFSSATGSAAHDADVKFILSDLVQSYKVEESLALAESLQREAVAGARRLRPGLRDIGAKPGPFYVLVGAGMPAVLVEISFLSNPDEGRALAQNTYREALADGILRGLLRFVESRRDAETL